MTATDIKRLASALSKSQGLETLDLSSNSVRLEGAKTLGDILSHNQVLVTLKLG